MPRLDSVFGVFHPSIGRKMGASFARPEQIVGQAYANSVPDAHATRFDASFEKGGVVVFTDDGDGMRPEDIGKFVGMGDPHKAGNPDMLGANGTGKTSFFTSHRRISVWTATADSPEEISFSFTDEDAAAAMLGTRPVTLAYKRKGTRGTRCGDHGTVIELSEARPGKTAFTPARLRRFLPRFIAPWDFDKVTVEGEPLKPTNPLGEIFTTGSEGVLVEGVGQVFLTVGVTDKRVDEDFRSWGSWEHVCTQAALRRELPEKLQPALPAELDHPSVWFSVRVRAWKDFEAEQTRDSYAPDLFTSPLFGNVILWIRLNVLPQLRHALGTDTPVSDDVAEAIREVSKFLAERISDPVGPEEDKKREPRGERQNVFRINPADVELIVGTQFTFALENVPDDAQIRVNAAGSGGEVWNGKRWTQQWAGREIREIRYQAGKVFGSRFVLEVVMTPKAGGEPQTVYAHPALVVEHRFSISPRRATCDPGERARSPFKLVNAQGLSGFRWECEGASVSPSADALQATLTAGTASGSFRVTCRAKDAKGVEHIAEALLNVRKLVESGERKDIVASTIHLDGIRFVILTGGVGTDRVLTTHLRARNEVTIYINDAHPAAERAKKDGLLRTLIMEEVLFWIASVLASIEEDTVCPAPEAVNEKRSELRVKLVS